MQKILKSLFVVVTFYVLSLVLLLGFYSLLPRFEALANLERKMNPSTFTIWQNGEFYSRPPLFVEELTDPNGYLDFRHLVSLQEVDVFVLLFEGFEQAKTAEIVQQLGLNPKTIARLQNGKSQILMRSGISARWHVVPFVFTRRVFVLMDAEALREKYIGECLDDIVYQFMIQSLPLKLADNCLK